MELIIFFGKGIGFWILLGVLIAVLFALAFVLKRSSKQEYTGRVLMPVAVIEIGILFGILALGFSKSEGDPVGPGVVPALWIIGIFILGIYLLIRALTGHEDVDPPWGRMDVVGIYLLMIVLYVVLMQILGYALSTLCFLILGMYYLGYRRWRVMLSVTVGWILFSYFAFYKLLYVPLPKGVLIERIFG